MLFRIFFSTPTRRHIRLKRILHANYFQKMLFYLFEGLQQVAARNRQGDVYVVHDEERLLLALVWETSEVVCYKQQHVHFRLLQRERKEGEEHERESVPGPNSHCSFRLLEF